MINFLRLWFIVTVTLLTAIIAFVVLFFSGVRSPWIGGIVSPITFTVVHLAIFITRNVRREE